MRTGWVLRGAQVLAAADIADGLVERSRGPAGRPGHEAALVLVPGVPVHSLAVGCGVDVAFLDPNLRVVEVIRLPPWRVARPRRGCRAVLEATAGSFERWSLAVGDVLDIREVDSGRRGGPPLFPIP